MMPLWRCHWSYGDEFFFTNSPWYYLTPYQNLLKSNVILMVRKIGQILLKRGGRDGGGNDSPQAPSLCTILGPRRQVRSENFFMDKCPKDEPTAKNLVRNKSSSHSRENWKNLFGRGGGGGGDIHSSLAIWGFNILSLAENRQGNKNLKRQEIVNRREWRSFDHWLETVIIYWYNHW